VLGPIVFVVTFAVYAWTAAPAMTWLDAPEFAAAAQSLGVPHSPGQPLAPFLGHLATLMPIGGIAFRVALLSSAVQALATAVLAHMSYRLSDDVAPDLDRRARQISCGLFALVFAFAWAIWFQGVRCEVYALAAALLAGTLALVLRYHRSGDQRFLVAASLVLGMAVATHHFMAVLVAVPLAVFALARRQDRPTATTIAAGAGAAILGLGIWLYLPLRAAGNPIVNWGNPTSLDRLWWTISAQAFHKTAGAEQVSSGFADFVQAFIASAESIGWATLLCLPGIYVLWKRARSVAALFVAIIVLTVAGRAVLGFDIDTPDHYAYLSAALLVLAALASAGALVLANKIAEQHPAVPFFPAVLAAALVLMQLSANLEKSDLSDAYGADELATIQLSNLPPRALLLTAYFQSTFRVWAARTVSQTRPDLSFLDRSFLTYPGMAESAKKRYPELSAVIDAPLRAGLPSPLGVLDELLQSRPILVELHPNVDPQLRSRLVPIGSFAMYARRQPDANDFAVAENVGQDTRRRLATLLAESPPAADHATLSAVLWHDFVHLTHFCERGQRAQAQIWLNRARELAPNDVSLVEIARGCGLR
jgi:hypothetical protein